jgi:hypothetical protein
MSAGYVVTRIDNPFTTIDKTNALRPLLQKRANAGVRSEGRLRFLAKHTCLFEKPACLRRPPQKTNNMKTLLCTLAVACAACCLTSCDTDVNVPPGESKTTVVTPGEKKEEHNTTIVTPSAEKKTESSSSTTTTNSGGGSTTQSTQTETKSN